MRDRGDDLPLLVRHYLRRFGRELGREVREVAPEALERLRAYPWPGNIRELQSVLKRALLRANGTVLLPAFLPELGGGPHKPSPTEGVKGDGAAPAGGGLEAVIRQRLGPDAHELYAETHRDVDRLLLPLVLEHTRGNQFQAARVLGIARQTLRQKVRDLGLNLAHSVEADDLV